MGYHQKNPQTLSTGRGSEQESTTKMMRCPETQPPGMDRDREEHPYNLQPVEMAAKTRTDHLPVVLGRSRSSRLKNIKLFSTMCRFESRLTPRGSAPKEKEQAAQVVKMLKTPNAAKQSQGNVICP